MLVLLTIFNIISITFIVKSFIKIKRNEEYLKKLKDVDRRFKLTQYKETGEIK